MTQHNEPTLKIIDYDLIIDPDGTAKVVESVGETLAEAVKAAGEHARRHRETVEVVALLGDPAVDDPAIVDSRRLGRVTPTDGGGIDLGSVSDELLVSIRRAAQAAVDAIVQALEAAARTIVEAGAVIIETAGKAARAVGILPECPGCGHRPIEGPHDHVARMARGAVSSVLAGGRA